MNDIGEHDFEIFVKFLPYSTTEAQLREFFEECGPVIGEARLLRHPQTGQCKGVGWVSFAHRKAFQAALRRDGQDFLGSGRHISVSEAIKGKGGVRPTHQAFGTHTPAMLAEVLTNVVTSVDGVYVDGTFGRGGHTRAFLERLSPKGRLHAFDLDPEAVAAGNILEEEDARFTIHHAPFSTMASVLKSAGVKADGILLDLGISSPQFDDDQRGFRPEQDGPLDLRFDQSKGVPAWEFLTHVDRSELVRILSDLGETTDHTSARRIADAICIARDSKKGLPRTTKDFASLVADAKGIEYQQMHPAKLTFQGLRIHLNKEFEELRLGMHASLKCLRDGGVLGIITWKHTECQILMDFYREHEPVREESPLWQWLKHADQQKADNIPIGWGMTMGPPLRPSAAELSTNSRARSALLHILTKTPAVLVPDVERVAYPLLGHVDAPLDTREKKSKRRKRTSKK